jgi:Zn-dependent peptidase ImmA (M78 family)
VIRRYAEARQAVAAALEIRQRLGIAFDDPVSIIDIALARGVTVWFKRLSSTDGLWCKEKRTIVLTSLRPAGRRTFTCAHELGHCVFNHGTRFDELLEYAVTEAFDPEEYLANEFAAHLLMPFYAVSQAIQTRRWNPATLTAPQVYTLASYFGVSYRALLNHLYYALRLIRTPFAALSRISPKMIRSMFCPDVSTAHLVIVDDFWGRRPIDLEVGDLVILPRGVQFEGRLLDVVPEKNTYGITASAHSPGVGYISKNDGAQLLLRIVPREFEGFADYRFPDQNNVYVSS